MESLGIVVWGSNLGSNVGKKLSKKELNMIQLSSENKGIIVGLLLSDGWLGFSNQRSKNTRLGLKQSFDNFNYVWYVFTQLTHFCNSYPYSISGIRNHNKYFAVCLQTRALSCLTELHTLFYPNKTKIIPNNIYDLLTPVALAHWIIGDGSARSTGLVLCTDSYTIQEVVKLTNVLKIKYHLECTIRYHRPGHPRIYIRKQSIETLRIIVNPYIIPSMRYKLQNEG